MAKFCAARNAGTERRLPIRRPKPQPTIVRLDLLLVRRAKVLRRADSIYLVHRSEGERRLAGFWELPEKSGAAKCKSQPICEFRHRIVNDIFEVTVWESAISKVKQGRWVELTQIAQIPLTTITKKALAAAGFC